VTDRPLCDLSRSAAEAIVRRVAPTATVTELVVRAGGQLSTVYEARCAEPDEALEVHVYRLLARHDAGPCPTILLAESTGERTFTVMTLLPGEPLSAISTQLDDAELHRIYRQLGMVLSAVHRIGQNSYGYLTTRILDPQPTNTAYMTRQFAKKLLEFAGYGGDPALHHAIEAHATERVELFAHCSAPVLCHNADPADGPTTRHDRRNCVMAVRSCTVAAQY
jgi:hygromycin-B 7''-O-kinase